MSKPSRRPSPTPRARPAKAAPVTPARVYTLFVTRDSDPETGAPNERVEAWFARPTRYAIGERGAFWLPEAGVADRAATWSLVDCRRRARTIPDDDRQCLRIEGDEMRVPS